MVQVIKAPIGTKGARLSTQISIAGRLLVLLPQDDHIGISQKIPQGERDALRARLQGLVGTKETGGGGGFVLRTNGEDSRCRNSCTAGVPSGVFWPIDRKSTRLNSSHQII